MRERPHTNLTQKCSQYFDYRDFIECGETFISSSVSNTPQAPETWQAIKLLAINILDPVVNQFGPLHLTYGFAGQQLLSHLRRIKAPRIAPELDQHAGHELNTRGNRICKRDGFACDFVIEGTSSKIIAAWIIDNCPFDRLYYYGEDRPLHVSHSHQPSGSVCVMQSTRSGRRMPRTIRADHFAQYRSS